MNSKPQGALAKAFGLPNARRIGLRRIEDITKARMTSDPSIGELTSFKLSFPEDFACHDDGFVPEFHTTRYASQQDLQVGDGCLMDGFPCRITRVHKRGPLMDGAFQYRFYGVGLLDQKARTVTMGADYCQEALVPTKVDAPLDDVSIVAAAGKEDNALFPVLPVVSWLDGTNRPQDNDHFVLTVKCRVTPSEQGQFCTTVWVIPKAKECYHFFLQERERFMVRERNKRRFLLFLMITKRQESSSAVLGEVDVSGVLQNMFDFVCEPRVLTLSDDDYVDED